MMNPLSCSNPETLLEVVSYLLEEITAEQRFSSNHFLQWPRKLDQTEQWSEGHI